MTIKIVPSNVLETLPVFEGFYTIEHAYTLEEAQAREAERQARRKKHW